MSALLPTPDWMSNSFTPEKDPEMKAEVKSLVVSKLRNFSDSTLFWNLELKGN